MSIPLTDIHVAEVVINGHLLAEGSDQQVCKNVFHYRRSATAVDPNKVSVFNIFKSSIIDPLKALVHSDWEVETVSVRWIDDALDQALDVVPGTAIAGAITTADAPDALCVSMLYRTNVRGRNYKGAKRFGGLPVASITGDIIAASAQAAWQSLAAALATPLVDADGNTWNPCVLSRELSVLVSNPTVVETADVTQVLLNLNIGTMNSRKPKTVR